LAQVQASDHWAKRVPAGVAEAAKADYRYVPRPVKAAANKKV